MSKQEKKMINKQTSDKNLQRSKEAFVSIQNLEKIYPNGAKAVYDFNLDIQRNEFIVIVGPSGCGKTTTLRMIAGLEDISAGDIFVDGEFINYKPSKDRKMAIVFQSYALYPQMSVYDNIAFPLTINKYELPLVAVKLQAAVQALNVLKKHQDRELLEILEQISRDARIGKIKRFELAAKRFGISLAAAEKICKVSTLDFKNGQISKIISAWEEEVKIEQENLKANNIVIDENFQHIDENGRVIVKERALNKYEIRMKVVRTAETLDLGDYLDRLPKELSGGQMQRVALGRAIVKNLPLFLMDEPLSNLDAKLRLTMRSEIVKIHNKINATTVYVTHDQTEAMTMATRIVVMSKGFVQQIDTPQQIYDNPKNLFVAKFVGSPAINVLNGTIDIKQKKILIGDKIELKIGEAQVKKHDEFYQRKLSEFQDVFAKYEEDYRAREYVLKVLSSVGSHKHKSFKRIIKPTLFSRVKNLFKHEVHDYKQDTNYKVFQKMIEKIKAAQVGVHNIVLAIRPERMNVSLFDASKEYKNAYIVTPTVCELLGYEYIVHFDFLGKEITAKIDSKNFVSLQTKLVVTFDNEDLLFFDEISGERIF